MPIPARTAPQHAVKANRMEDAIKYKHGFSSTEALICPLGARLRRFGFSAFLKFL
jgi:hypothetical protein